VSLPLKRAVLKSAAPRPIHRRSERHRGSQSKSAPRTVRPQQSGLEQDSGRPDTLVGDAPRRFAERAENWKFASHHHTGMTVRACDDVAGVSAHRFHVDGRRSAWSATCRKQGRIAGRAGVSGNPHHEGLPDQGAVPEPFAPVPMDALLPLERALLPLFARSPSGLRFAPTGFAAMRRWGEGGAAAGRGRGSLRPVLRGRVRKGPLVTGARRRAGRNALELRANP
jgi:hypothetical protein